LGDSARTGVAGTNSPSLARLHDERNPEVIGVAHTDVLQSGLYNKTGHLILEPRVRDGRGEDWTAVTALINASSDLREFTTRDELVRGRAPTNVLREA
jgi:hypothetical protein